MEFEILMFVEKISAFEIFFWMRRMLFQQTSRK